MFLPARIDLENTEKYKLSIRIGSRKFMFSLSKGNEGKNFCFRETSFESTNESLLERLQRIIYELNFLTQQFEETNVIFASHCYQLIPSLFFNKKQKKELFNFSEVGESYILASELPKYESMILSGIDADVYGFMKRSLYNPHFYNQSELLINYFEGNKKSVSLHARMYVELTDSLLNILCFRGKTMLYTVSYEDLLSSEQLYFILKIWESLGLDQLQDQLFISDTIEQSVTLVLKQYIKNIEKINLPSEVYLWHTDALKAPLDLLSLSL